jgi:hypothetical protein
MIYHIHDLIEDYDEQNNKDIQWNTTERKEFYELKGTATEKQPSPGEFFKHQDLFLRYAKQYDRIFSIHDTGTGKTGSMINLAEYYRTKEPGKIKKVIVLEPGPPTVDDFKDQIIKLSTDDFYRNDNILESEDKAMKNNLTRLINKNYEVTTYQKFCKDNLINKKIEEYYSDCIFFFDEAHKLRNLADNSGSSISEEERENIYNYLWRVTHVAKRIKVIVATATPMINSVKDFVPLVNLLLDENNQFPLVKEDNFYETLSLSQVEPFFRGMFTFVRFLDTSVNIKNKGYEIDNFVHKIKIPSEQKTDPIIPDRKKSENNNIICEFQAKKQPIPDFKIKNISSKVTIYPLIMKGIQLETYKKVSKLKQDAFYRNSRQSSVFVFPDGSYGTTGFRRYIKKDENNYVFKKSIIVKGKSVVPLSSYLLRDNMEKTLKNLSQLSCKFAEFIRIEFEASEKERKGNSFCYLDQVEGSGVILLGLILENLGFENFTTNDSTIVNNRTGKIRQDFPKAKRFAIITGKTNNLRNILKVFNNPNNIDGEYIQILLASEVARDGINLKNVLRGYILSAGWHESGMHQALSRFIRATSHEELLTRKKLETKENNAKINVDIYRMAAVTPGELDNPIEDYRKNSIDIRNYLEAEDKDIKIKRVLRFMKLCAFDAYLNYERNFRKTDKDYSKKSDYDVALPRLPYSEGTPLNTKRKGIAMNQGPSKKELIYNTYNLFYSDKDKETSNFREKILHPAIIKKGFITFNEILENIPPEIKLNNYEILNDIIEEILENRPLLDNKNLIEYNLEFIGNNFFLSRKNIFNYSNYLSTEDYYSFTEINTDYSINTDIILKEEKLSTIYFELKGKTKSQIITYYSIKQNYSDFKLLLEDSLIRLRDGTEDKLNKIILDLFYNYYMVTKIPTGWFEAVEKSLQKPESRKQGRKRAEGSLAGLKDLNLDDVDPKFSKEKVFVHFYRETDKTGFNITSILEGKFRKIRILEGEKFRDTNQKEEYIYTKLFDNFYEKILEKYKKSKYYGSYIYRGGEQKEKINDRKKEFFRIVNTSNPRNKGKVCINNTGGEIKEVIQFLDTSGKYKKYYQEKIKNKNEICEIIQKLFEEKDLLFISL